MVAQGKKVAELEEFWAGYTKCRHAVACGSGGAALEIIMRALNVKNRDVLVPTNTFIATVNAIIFAGGNPVFLDADPKTMCVNLKEIEDKVTKKTVGVVVVHIGGIIAPQIEEISQWCKKRDLWLVEDGAHAQGSEFNGKKAGNFGIAAAYSFFATKVITSGEGGMVVCNDDNLAQLCRSLRDYGKKSQWESVHAHLSGNCRMSEITAIVGLSQSKRLNEFIKSRAAVAKRYTEGLHDVLELILPQGASSWYKYIALLPEDVEKEKFKARLQEKRVSLSGGVYDLPIHLQPVFENRNLSGSLPISEDICRRHICLPIFYGMSQLQIDYTIECVRDLINNDSVRQGIRRKDYVYCYSRSG
jgi:dTDP-4-amino-4,6-dideoxygalactose transaminase